MFYNKHKQVVERIDIKKMSQKQMNDVMIQKGFYKKTTKEEEVPEEYRKGPYIEKDEI